MTKVQISRSKEPIRLFESDFLEFFTHIHPAVVAVLWTPVVIVFAVLAMVRRPAGWLFVPICFLCGLFGWTLAEYLLHRFVFHWPPRAPWQERLTFLFHGIHHTQPRSKTRLVMPPVVSIPLAVVFWVLFWVVLGVVFGVPHWVPATFAGFVAGYLAYDMLHYAMHHAAIKSAAFKYIRRYHMLHHTQTPDLRYGVSSPLWDIVFCTKPAD